MFGIRFRYFFILLLSVYSYLNIRLTTGEKLLDFPIPQFYFFGLLSVVVFGVWELNRLVENRLDFLSSKVSHKIHPVLIVFMASLANVMVVTFLCLQILYVLLGMDPVFNANHFTLLLLFGFRVNLFLNCINAIVYFMNRLKQTQLQAEEFKKISIEAKFEALRNQINPHFLFNCFNVLSTLVYRDADTSAKFIEQLSNVYRYLLDNQEKKVVPLADEVKYINAYLFLLKIRFGENIAVDIDINFEGENFFVAPGVLQMLIENAIKHNIISRKKPLRVRLYKNDMNIMVDNNLQEKEIKEPSTLMGLKNIERRYAFLTDRQVIIEKTDLTFRVKIPLLRFDQ